jgi:glutathione synthase
MKHLFIIDPIEDFKVEKDTTLAFMLECQARGHHIWTANLGDVFASNDGPGVQARFTTVRHEVGNHFDVQAKERKSLSFFDAIWNRKDPPVTPQYWYVSQLLDLVDGSETFVLNRQQGVRDCNEKLFILQFPDLIAETMVSRNREQLLQFTRDIGGKAVFKPLDGMGGTGIFIAEADSPNFNSIFDAVSDHGNKLMMAQRYLPEAKIGDKRIILLNGEPLGAILRVPQGVDFRGNMAVGGIAEGVEITAREHEIIERLAPELRRRGLYFVGLDVIGEKITEINVTCPTGVQEIDREHDLKIEEDVVDFVESKVAELQQ